MGLSNNKIRNIIITIVSIVIVAILGSIFVNLGMDWFNGLEKPSQWIPNIVIPIVWSVIYITFGVVLSIWISKSGIPLRVVICLIINGLINVLWCLVFFTLHLTFVGNLVIILNLIAGIVLFVEIYKSNKIYSWINSVYPIWLSFATSLNMALWILN
jgi:tryptophan-rich sensory protein